MAKKHGARQQKRIAKQKAKRQAKRSLIARRTSKDPTVRLQRVETWEVLKAYVSEALWEEGIGYVVVSRKEPDGETVFATFLVDVLCLGVKDAFWRAGTMETFREVVEEMDKIQTMREIKPACAAKIVRGTVEFAQTFGFPPHADYRHASHLLEGIDPSACREHFEFGENGKPLYIQGPNETPVQAIAIAERVREVGGECQMVIAADDVEVLDAIEDDLEEDDDDPEDDNRGGSRWRWFGPR